MVSLFRSRSSADCTIAIRAERPSRGYAQRSQLRLSWSSHIQKMLSDLPNAIAHQ